MRASVWLGREEELRTWWDARTDLQLTVYAETYENQVGVGGGNVYNVCRCTIIASNVCRCTSKEFIVCIDIP